MKLQKKLLGTAVAAMLALSACSSQPTPPVAPTGESGPENTAELQTEAKANEGTDNEVLETPEKVKGETLAAEDIDPNGGADLNRANDHKVSKYWVNPDFYNMESDEEVTILKNFKTMQQTSEFSCAPSSVTMSLEYLGVPMTEWEAAVGMHCNMDEDVEGALPGSADSWYEPGANIGKIVNYLKTIPDIEIVEANYIENPTEDDLVGDEDIASLKYSPVMKGNYKKYFDSSALYSSENNPNTDKWVTDAKDSFFVKWLTGHIKEGHPIITHTNLWNGHYVVIIGYDNMGTPQLGDDVLIIADPYDTWDHWQDGYIVQPVEEFFFEWNDFNIAQKPYQLQPFVVVGKKSS